MKIQKKSAFIKRNLIRYAKTERDVMAIIDHPFMSKIYYSF
jgi:hypothetical protein